MLQNMVVWMQMILCFKFEKLTKPRVSLFIPDRFESWCQSTSLHLIAGAYRMLPVELTTTWIVSSTPLLENIIAFMSGK